MKDKNIENIRLQIQTTLKKSHTIKDAKGKSLDELLEEINIYYQELEFQNDELSRIREELELSQSHFADLFNNAPIGYVIYTSDLKIKSTNQTFLKMLDTTIDVQDNISLTDYIHPDSQDIFYHHVKNILKNSEPQSCKIELSVKNRTIPVKIESNMLNEPGNKIIRSAFIDIRNEKDAEAKSNLLNQELTLKNSELLEYRRRLDASMLAGNIAWWHLNYKTGEVNFSEQKTIMLGFDAKDFTHYKHFTDLVHPDDYEPMMENMRDHISGRTGLYKIDYRIKTSSGDYKWFLDVGSVTERDINNKPLVIMGVVVDITERMVAEIELEESLKNFQKLFDTMGQGVVYQDSDGKIISANAAALNILGLTLDQIKGRTSLDPEWKTIKDDGSDFPGDMHPAMISLKPVNLFIIRSWEFITLYRKNTGG